MRARVAVTAGVMTLALAGIWTSMAAAAGAPEAEPPRTVEADRVRVIIAAATVSGVAAVTGWFVLRGRRGQDDTLHRMDRPPGDATDVDVEQLIAPDGIRHDRRAGTVTSSGPAPLWQAEDDRPRWIRRLDDQKPARIPAKRSAERWTVDEGDEESPR